jgi:hypothetical protein
MPIRVICIETHIPVGLSSHFCMYYCREVLVVFCTACKSLVNGWLWASMYLMVYSVKSHLMEYSRIRIEYCATLRYRLGDSIAYRTTVKVTEVVVVAVYQDSQVRETRPNTTYTPRQSTKPRIRRPRRSKYSSSSNQCTSASTPY